MRFSRHLALGSLSLIACVHSDSLPRLICGNSDIQGRVKSGGIMDARYLMGRFITMMGVCLVGGSVMLTGAGAAGAAGAARAGGAIGSAAAQPAAVVTDTGMGMRTKVGLPAPAMSEAMLAANAAKQVLARSFVKAMQADVAAASKCADGACPSALPASKNLKQTQRAQIHGYYCGPATVSEMLAQMGKTVR